MSSPIPIRNIYFLLCYAWNRLEEGEITNVSGIDSSELADLFATVLISGVRHLLRRGLGRGYESFEEDLTTLRGRVMVAESGRRMMTIHGRARCEFDELTINTWPNRVIKATMRHLSGAPTLDEDLRGQLLNLSRELKGVDPIPLNRLAFRSVQLHSNARFYRFLLNICELVVSSWLVDEQTGTYKFRDFLRDEKRMARVFESFVFNLVRLQRPSLDVRKERIPWAATKSGDSSLRYLPTMETDISVRNPLRTLVIDAKYYQETLTRYFDTERVRSDNLYQIFAYLKNLEVHGGQDATAAGMLLYPTVDQSLRLEYHILGHNIFVCTLNLNQEWQGLRDDLLRLVDLGLQAQNGLAENNRHSPIRASGQPGVATSEKAQAGPRS